MARRPPRMSPGSRRSGCPHQGSPGPSVTRPGPSSHRPLPLIPGRTTGRPRRRRPLTAGRCAVTNASLHIASKPGAHLEPQHPAAPRLVSNVVTYRGIPPWGNRTTKTYRAQPHHDPHLRMFLTIWEPRRCPDDIRGANSINGSAASMRRGGLPEVPCRVGLTAPNDRSRCRSTKSCPPAQDLPRWQTALACVRARLAATSPTVHGVGLLSVSTPWRNAADAARLLMRQSSCPFASNHTNPSRP